MNGNKIKLKAHMIQPNSTPAGRSSEKTMSIVNKKNMSIVNKKTIEYRKQKYLKIFFLDICSEVVCYCVATAFNVKT